jgi:hypothetical protein
MEKLTKLILPLLCVLDHGLADAGATTKAKLSKAFAFKLYDAVARRQNEIEPKSEENEIEPNSEEIEIEPNSEEPHWLVTYRKKEEEIVKKRKEKEAEGRKKRAAKKQKKLCDAVAGRDRAQQRAARRAFFQPKKRKREQEPDSEPHDGNEQPHEQQHQNEHEIEPHDGKRLLVPLGDHPHNRIAAGGEWVYTTTDQMDAKHKQKNEKTVVPLTPQQQALEEASARLELAKAQVQLAQMQVDMAKMKGVQQLAIPPSTALSSSALEGVPCWGSSRLKPNSLVEEATTPIPLFEEAASPFPTPPSSSISSMYRRIPVMTHTTDSLYALGRSSEEEGYADEDLTQMEGEPDEFVEDSQEQNQVVDSMSPQKWEIRKQRLLRHLRG